MHVHLVHVTFFHHHKLSSQHPWLGSSSHQLSLDLFPLLHALHELPVTHWKYTLVGHQTSIKAFQQTHHTFHQGHVRPVPLHGNDYLPTRIARFDTVLLTVAQPLFENVCLVVSHHWHNIAQGEIIVCQAPLRSILVQVDEQK